MRGQPVPWARAGHSGKVSFTPKRQREAMRSFALLAGQVMGSQPPLEGPLSISLTFAYPWPKAVSRKTKVSEEGRYRTARPDIDNLIKLVADALNTVVWQDDAQIAEVIAKKIYSETPLVQLQVFQIASRKAVAA